MTVKEALEILQGLDQEGFGDTNLMAWYGQSPARISLAVEIRRLDINLPEVKGSRATIHILDEY